MVVPFACIVRHLGDPKGDHNFDKHPFASTNVRLGPGMADVQNSSQDFCSVPDGEVEPIAPRCRSLLRRDVTGVSL